MNLIEEIDRHGQIHPDRIAHSSGSTSITYAELCRRSDALAGGLQARLGEDRRPIAVRGHKEPEMLIAFLGVVKSGRAYAPIDVAIPEQRAEAIIRAADASLTLTPDLVRALSAGSAEVNKVVPSSEAPFYIIFTSGTTGEPKGVVITHGCLSAFVEWMRAEQQFLPGGEVFLNQAPFSFDLSVMDLYLSLVTGGTLVSITREEIAAPKDLFARLATSGITTWVSTPSFAQMCLVDPAFRATMLPRVCRFLFCGETLPREVAEQLLSRFPEAATWNTYGPTEATVATTSIRIDETVIRENSLLPVGYAMPGSDVIVCDSDGRPVPDGQRGEIHIAGPNVSPGYIGRPDLSSRVFYDRSGVRAYRTGDRGCAKGGLLFCEGRMDQQIKLNGYRIELGDVESHVRHLPGISEAVVVPKVSDGRVESLIAYVVLPQRLESSDFRESQRLRAELGRLIPAYMVPRKFVFLDAFPMTANGKADRKRLSELHDSIR